MTDPAIETTFVEMSPATGTTGPPKLPYPLQFIIAM